MQKEYQRAGNCDIEYNILIGGSNNDFFINEGKGFSHQEKFQQNFTAKNLDLSIGLIGREGDPQLANLESAAASALLKSLKLKDTSPLCTKSESYTKKASRPASE